MGAGGYYKPTFLKLDTTKQKAAVPPKLKRQILDALSDYSPI